MELKLQVNYTTHMFKTLVQDGETIYSVYCNKLDTFGNSYYEKVSITSNMVIALIEAAALNAGPIKE